MIKDNDFAPDDLPAYLESHYENLVTKLKMGAEIFHRPTDKNVQEILRGDGPLYGQEIYIAGCIPDDSLMCRTDKVRLAADAGPINRYGVQGLLFGPPEWVADKNAATSNYLESQPVRGGGPTYYDGNAEGLDAIKEALMAAHAEDESCMSKKSTIDDQGLTFRVAAVRTPKIPEKAA